MFVSELPEADVRNARHGVREPQAAAKADGSWASTTKRIAYAKNRNGIIARRGAETRRIREDYSFGEL
jgi:hypothetical protein